ncbi:sensor histidine kinase [Leptospira jelokensis]|uniref:sensor histidine kinase n=1 Tax=Leptospira jelokensis TaxID=2484931 RepID=UPI001090DA5C|nr:histidine kinase [Leptospira jelokensis]TGM06619.1 histidine kinase [Leptospira jelokensis]
MTLYQKIVQNLLGREYDPISLIAVYSEILNKLYLLGFAYTIAYAQSVYLEWGKVDLTNCYLSFVQLLISLLLVGISFFYTNTNGFVSKLVRFSFFALVLVEIETGFHDPNIPYFDPRNWLTIIALIGTTSFFYPGLVWQFISEWTIVFFLYLARVAFKNAGSIPEETWREMSTTVPLFLVAFFLNHWWFQTRYIAAYRGMLLEEKRRTFFQDIHDSLGSKLTDLYLLSQSFEQNPNQVAPPQIQKMKELASDALQSLRNQVKEEDHREILQESLVDGIHLLVKKRYKSLGREISIALDPVQDDKLIQIKEPEHAHHLLQILKEITTNDLRHGLGKTTCQVMVKEETLCIHFLSEVQTQVHTKNTLEPNLNPPSLEIGLGMKGIEQRVRFLQGEVDVVDFPFQILIKLPKSIFTI